MNQSNLPINSQPTQDLSLQSEEMLRLRRVELGRVYAELHKLTADIQIGYSNNNFPDGHDPWGGPCKVAFIGFAKAGGGEILAAGKPIWHTATGWIPLLATNTPEDGFSFRGKFTDYLTMITAAAMGSIIVQPGIRLTPNDSGYLEWLGFLRELQISKN